MIPLKNVCFAEFRRFRQSLISPLIPDLPMSATISETKQVSETAISSEAQNAQQVEMLSERKITSSRNLNMNDDSVRTLSISVSHTSDI
jgi:hypothetical protein